MAPSFEFAVVCCGLLRIHNACHLKSSMYGQGIMDSELLLLLARDLKFSLCGRGIMDSELLLKFIGYFSDHLSALLGTLLRFFLDNLCRNI